MPLNHQVKTGVAAIVKRSQRPPFPETPPKEKNLRRDPPGEGNDVGGRADEEDRIVGGSGDPLRQIGRQEGEGIASGVRCDLLDADPPERALLPVVLVPEGRGVAGGIAVLADNGEQVAPDAICDAFTFLPSNLAEGITGPADDPIFLIRSPAYLVSFTRRLAP